MFYYHKLAIKLFIFLQAVIDYSALYKLIKARMDWLINDVLPVALSITKEERELWTEDPIQFVNQVYDVCIEDSICLPFFV